MDEYGQRAARLSKTRSVELENTLAKLAEAVRTLSAENKTAISNLHGIERQLQGASTIEDIRTIKVRLSECLAAVQEESLRQERENARTLLQMQQQLQQSKEWIEQSGQTRDPLTGLLDSTEAEEALRNALEHGSHAFAALFLVHHLQMINQRFGYAIGDQVVNLYGGHIRQNLKAGDQVFRWRGPCFLGLLGGFRSTAEMRSELHRICSARLEKFFETGTRSALLSISSSWTVFDLRENHTIEDLMRQIVDFVNKEWRETESSKTPGARPAEAQSTSGPASSRTTASVPRP
jgi:diguanylate cyclase (GGDEF)-like protein